MSASYTRSTRPTAGRRRLSNLVPPSIHLDQAVLHDLLGLGVARQQCVCEAHHPGVLDPVQRIDLRNTIIRRRIRSAPQAHCRHHQLRRPTARKCCTRQPEISRGEVWRLDPRRWSAVRWWPCTAWGRGGPPRATNGTIIEPSDDSAVLPPPSAGTEPGQLAPVGATPVHRRARKRQHDEYLYDLEEEGLI